MQPKIYITMRLMHFFKKDSWKSKAVNRSKEIKTLSKRIKELIASRDKIKKKNTRLRVEKDELKKENIRLKNELKKN